jgi:hypothetical protein
MFLGLPDPDPSLFVRIRIWILPSTSKKSKINFYFFILFYDFFDFLLLKTDVNVPSKSYQQIFNYFLLASCQPLT